MTKKDKKKTRAFKVAFCGSPGTGRNLIAQCVSDRLSIPLITGAAKQVLKEEKYAYSTTVSVEKFLARPELQFRIAETQRKKEDVNKRFISDRSWVDLAAYAIIELHNNSEFDISSYLEECREEAMKFDLTVYVPWNRVPLTSDGMRTLNPWYQFIVDAVIFNLIHKWNLPHLSIPVQSTTKVAVEHVVKHLGRLVRSSHS